MVRHALILIPACLVLLLGISASAFIPIDRFILSFALVIGSIIILCGALIAVLFLRRMAIPILASYLPTIAILLTVAFTHLPFHWSFSASRTQLENLAAQVKAGEEIPLPIKAGAFRILEITPHKTNQSILFTTYPDPSGAHGFVYQYPGGGYNLWSLFQLDDNWHFLTID